MTCGATAGFSAKLDLRQIFFRQVEILGSTMGSKGHLLEALPMIARRAPARRRSTAWCRSGRRARRTRRSRTARSSARSCSRSIDAPRGAPQTSSGFPHTLPNRKRQRPGPARDHALAGARGPVACASGSDGAPRPSTAPSFARKKRVRLAERAARVRRAVTSPKASARTRGERGRPPSGRPPGLRGLHPRRGQAPGPQSAGRPPSGRGRRRSRGSTGSTSPRPASRARSICCCTSSSSTSSTSSTSPSRFVTERFLHVPRRDAHADHRRRQRVPGDGGDARAHQVEDAAAHGAEGQDDGLPGEEEEDPRAELVRRLLEYQKYKAAAAELAERGTLGKDVFGRGAPSRCRRGRRRSPSSASSRCSTRSRRS